MKLLSFAIIATIIIVILLDTIWPSSNDAPMIIIRGTFSGTIGFIVAHELDIREKL